MPHARRQDEPTSGEAGKTHKLKIEGTGTSLRLPSITAKEADLHILHSAFGMDGVR